MTEPSTADSAAASADDEAADGSAAVRSAAPPIEPLSEEQKSTIRVLVVDDEPTLRATCVSVLKLQGFDVTSTERGEEALQIVRRQDFDIMLLDLYMTQVPGMELLRQALARRPETLVVMMTGDPSVGSNLEALREGAWDYLPKPFSATHLDVLIGRAAHTVISDRANRAAEQVVPNAQEGVAGVDVVGASPAFRAALDLARKVARSNASVFLTGESGTGKELIAQLIHHNSRRSRKPLVAINCAALPETLLESEMFGHTKGSFTGAVRDKPGLFETAHGGTLFLDELTEMSKPTQAKLLRVLQDGVVRRVGSNQADAVVDVRLIAATNRDPAEAVEEGRLRSDLYYRLRVIPIRVPPLRERQEDIPLLAQHFLRVYWKRDHPRAPAPSLSEEALRVLRTQPWPGNVRELQNVIEHTVVLADPGQAIGPEAIPLIGADGPRFRPAAVAGTPAAAGPGLDGARSDGLEETPPLTTDADLDQEYHVARERVLADFERRYVVALVNRAGGNMSSAARMAGVDRTTLYRLIEKHGLERDTILRPK
jgi:DNA-binding NtrC family response regulator